MVTGVSIGAVNAAVLVGAKDDPIRTLDEMWRERFAIRDWPFMPQGMARYGSLLVNPAMYWIRPSYVYAPLLAPLLETCICDTSPLHWTLAELIDLKRLNSSQIHLVVSAVNIETGEITYFENKNGAQLSVDHLVASGSLAPSFPMTSIQDRQTGKQGWYWDGGFSSNLPLAKAINLLEQADAGNPDVERELIVVELFPMRSKVPATLIGVQDRIFELLFSSKLTLDQKLFHKINAFVDLIKQIDQELPPDSKIRQLPGYQELMSHRTINSFLVIASPTPELLTGASDFSKASIERRIAAGYRDALKQLEELGRVSR